MKFRRKIALIIAAVFMTNIVPSTLAVAEDDTDSLFTESENDTFKYNIYTDHIELTGIKKGTEPVIIPAEIDGLPVTDWLYTSPLSNVSAERGLSVADDNKYFEIIDECLICTNTMTDIGYFGGYRLENDTYTIPDGIKIIAKNAHSSDLWLHHINIPESVEIIGYGAFQGSYINELYIPKNVREIGRLSLNVFDNKKIELDSENPYYDMIDDSIMNEAHTELIRVTSYCDSEKYTIAEGIDTIDESAFINCKNIKDISFPSTYIGDYRFLEDMNNLENISVSEDNPQYTAVDGVLFSKDLKTLLKYPERKNDDGAYVVPEGTVKIGPLAFYFNHLRDITFPTTLTEMELYSLYTTYHYSGIMTFLNPDTPLSRCLVYLTVGYTPETYEEIHYVTVRGYKGSTAERFAKDNKADFEVIDGTPIVTTTSATTSTTNTTTSVTSTSTTTKNTTTSNTMSTTETTTHTIVAGDINSDNIVNTADLVTLSKFLLGSKTDITNTDGADINGDKIVDIFDLIAMRKIILKTK